MRWDRGQSPVVAIYNASVTKLVSYIYDACGNTTVVHHNGGESTSVVNNRFTYRGYYPDITATKGKRTIYYQTGRAKVDGSPIAREARALYDLQNKGYIVF